MFKFMCLALFVTLASGGNVNYSDCSAGKGSQILTLSINPSTACDSQSCTFKWGQNVNVNVEMVSNQDSQKATVQVDATNKLGMTLFSTGPQDATGTFCPLNKGVSKTVTYNGTIPSKPMLISNFEGTIKVNANGDKVNILCISLPCKITN